MDVDISNIGSINMDFVNHQSRGTFGQVSALRGTKSLYDTLVHVIRGPVQCTPDHRHLGEIFTYQAQSMRVSHICLIIAVSNWSSRIFEVSLYSGRALAQISAWSKLTLYKEKDDWALLNFNNGLRWLIRLQYTVNECRFGRVIYKSNIPIFAVNKKINKVKRWF